MSADTLIIQQVNKIFRAPTGNVTALPHIFLGIRLSIGVAWLGLVVAELMGASSGIGYIINDARSFSWTTVVFVGIMVFALVGKLSDTLVKWLEGRLLRWHNGYKGDDKS